MPIHSDSGRLSLWGKGVVFTCIEWGGGEAARLPWEKEIGEIPQGGSPRKLARSPTGKRAASPPPLTLNMMTSPGYLGKRVLRNPAIILNNLC
ncbi:hypothetical protein HLI_14365 [Halobacillus litoralis]|uniref:Uncharacterized protein n=1 Tax=Halobacillus litoralis TaxID=45668 RepID=A0A410MEX1_9BACI|nr:hypothetical protein HLI_14365 [Halobacillus litoralis]